jgi:hypothetical protein
MSSPMPLPQQRRCPNSDHCDGVAVFVLCDIEVEWMLLDVEKETKKAVRDERPFHV